MNISNRAEELFIQAQTLTPETRAQFITDACENDEGLLKEVNSLLEAANESGAYFERLSADVGLPALADHDASILTNKIVGQWRLGRLIGRGGMGSVYLADRADEQFEKQAALKILPFGLDGKDARSRFLLERQILARLVHDNIARLLDGGVTDEGAPYFVMDYVEGQPIDEYCTKNSLSVDEKLSLVLDVTSAVQFAHRNLVIHRDIKPGNVLVEENGRVRLLDFGIAKVIEPTTNKSELTQLAHRPVTPAFASPEMLSGAAVDVTTDVYSIGVLLYLLLTGRLPLDFEGLNAGELRDHVKDTHPVPVSRWVPTLRGDLDAIVAKALAKDPVDRYTSVESLANDLRCYLDRMPVSAKALSTWYRSRKFASRHALGVAFSLFAGIALSAITFLAISSAMKSEQQAREIAVERDRAEQTKEFLVEIFASADPNRESSTMTAREILDAGRERIMSELATQPEVQVDLLAAISEVYAIMRLTDEWREVLETEQRLRLELADDKSVEYAEVLVALSQAEDAAGNYALSEEHATQALQLAKRLDHAIARAAAHTRLGRIRHLNGDYEGGETGYLNALNIYRAEYGDEHTETTQLKLHLATLRGHQQRFKESLTLLQEVLATRERQHDGDHSEVTEVFMAMGSTLIDLERYDEAGEFYQRAFDMNDRLFGPDNSYNVFAANGLGNVAQEKGEYTLATELYLDSIRVMKKHADENANLGIALSNLGKVYVLDDRYDLALPVFRDAVQVLERHIPNHWILGDVRWRYGQCLLQIGDYVAAEPHIIAGIDALEEQWGREHEATQRAIAAAQELYEHWGKHDEAANYQ